MSFRFIVCILVTMILVGSSALDVFGENSSEDLGELRLDGGFTFSPMPETEAGSEFGERIAAWEWDTGVKMRFNAPPEEKFDPAKPTMLIIYALPNGNTTEWTIGKIPAEGEDWHFDIQNIGAQTRFLRELMTDRNIVTGYLEADGRSWPRWRRDRPNNAELIHSTVKTMILGVENGLGVENVEVFLTGHSGGGSFTFGFLNGCEMIPNYVKRIAFLDSNYGFEAAEGHGEKLEEWLRRNETNQLVVLAYDDRDVEFNGKKIVSPTGGTFRATHRMIDSFNQSKEEVTQQESKLKEINGLEESETAKYFRFRGFDGRLDFIAFKNPELKILHTVMVGEWNGLIHAATLNTIFNPDPLYVDHDRVYQDWMPPSRALPMPPPE